MSNTHESHSQRILSNGRQWLWVGGCFAGAVIVLSFVGWWAEVTLWPSRSRLKHQIADVKAGKTTAIYEPDPQLLEELLQDEQCASKVSEVLISPVNVSDKRYRLLKHFPHLEVIRLEYIGREHVEDVDRFLENIQGMASLRELWFHHAPFSAAAARHLSRLPHLTRLQLDNASDTTLRDISGLARLEELDLAYGTVGDVGVEYLKGMAKLQTLRLWYTAVTNEGVKKLKQALPKCKIERQGDTDGAE
jgi:hypothetical protein